MNDPSGPSPWRGALAGLCAGIVLVIAGGLALFQDPNESVPLRRRYDPGSQAWVPWDGDMSREQGPNADPSLDPTHVLQLGVPATILDTLSGESIALTGDGHGVAVGAMAHARDGTLIVHIRRDEDFDCAIVRVDPSARTITPLATPSDWGCSGEAPLLAAGDMIVLWYWPHVWALSGDAWQPLPPSPFDTDASFAAAPDGSLLATGDTLRTSPTWIGSLVAVTVLLLVVLVLLARSKQRGPAFAGLAVGLLMTPILLCVGMLVLFITGGGGPHGRPERRGGRRVRPRPLRIRAMRALPQSWRSLGEGLAWARDAAEEHASIAAFEDLARDLAAHGAPSDLIARAHAAAREEIEHRDACMAVAASLLGIELSPPLARRERDMPSPTLAEMAVASIEDGWLGEGRASERARADSTRHEGAVRTLLEKIAREEATHAQLGLDVARFALEAQSSRPPVPEGRATRPA